MNMDTNIDRISSLPDSLLCHILSFLPTTTSVATCVLSRRWRYLWEHLQVFDFFDNSSEPSPGEAPKDFVDFVNSVLILRRVRDIQKFSLSCACYTHKDITRWICAATGPHLQELNISLFAEDSPAIFLLPQSIFTCKALVSLYLSGAIGLDISSSVHFPSLKNLEVDIFGAFPINKLLSGCPVLETLQLKFVSDREPSMHMPPSLKSFTFDDETGLEINSLEIHTPALEYLDIYLKTICHQFSVSDLHNVVEVYLDILPEDKHLDFVPDLLKAICRVKFLELAVATTECLLLAPALDFPEFGCLVDLQLDIPYFDSRFLMDLLHNCDILQVFKFYDCKEVSDVSSWKPQYPEPSSWTQPDMVPKCVVSRLEIFKFGGYQDLEDEYAFVEYILQRGLVLKTMTINTGDSTDLEKRHQILKGLSGIPRGSNMCRLEFE